MTHVPASPRLAGVVGHPITQSKSPKLHGYWLRKYNILGHYIPLPIKPQNFETAVRALPKLGFSGVNITAPYKETVLPIVDKISDRAALIGAINTLIFRDDGTIYGDNTDGYGFIQNLNFAAPDWRPSSGPALILGAGGASRAVISALLSAGTPEIRIANRTRQRADVLRERFGAKIKVVDWSQTAASMEGTATIVNTTSLGMEGQPPLTITFDTAPTNALVTDIVYSPLQTPFLIAAAKYDLMTVDGLGMLLHQAVPGFEHWFGVKPTVDEDLRNTVLSA